MEFHNRILKWNFQYPPGGCDEGARRTLQAVSPRGDGAIRAGVMRQTDLYISWTKKLATNFTNCTKTGKWAAALRAARVIA